MASSRPIIVYGDNLIFNTRFKHTEHGKPITEILDIEYLITPYGLFLPTDTSEFMLLKYMKNPSEENKKKIMGFTHSGYLFTPAGDLVSITTGKSANYKIFVVHIPTGLGVRAIHNSETKAMENPATMLFGTDSFEQFISVYRSVYDPHGFTVCMKVDEIVELLKKHNITNQLEDSGLKLTDEDL